MTKYPTVKELKDRYIFLRNEQTKLRELQNKKKTRELKKEERRRRRLGYAGGFGYLGGVGMWSRDYSAKHDRRKDGYYQNRNLTIQHELEAIEAMLKIIHGYYPKLTQNFKREKITGIKLPEEMRRLNEKKSRDEISRRPLRMGPPLRGGKYYALERDGEDQWNMQGDGFSSTSYRATRSYFVNDEEEEGGKYETSEQLTPDLLKADQPSRGTPVPACTPYIEDEYNSTVSG